MRTVPTVAASRLWIQRSARAGSAFRAFAASHPSRFDSTSRAAFQSLFVKFRYPSIRSSLIRTSRPRPASAASVNRKASVPYLSITSSGSATLPFDFDIFWPSASRTRAWM